MKLLNSRSRLRIKLPSSPNRVCAFVRLDMLTFLTLSTVSSAFSPPVRRRRLELQSPLLPQRRTSRLTDRHGRRQCDGIRRGIGIGHEHGLSIERANKSINRERNL